MSKLKRFFVVAFSFIVLTMSLNSSFVCNVSAYADVPMPLPDPTMTVDMAWGSRAIVTFLSRLGFSLKVNEDVLWDTFVRSCIMNEGGEDPGEGYGVNSDYYINLRTCGEDEFIYIVGKNIPHYIKLWITGYFVENSGASKFLEELNSGYQRWLKPELNQTYKINLSTGITELVSDGFNDENVNLLKSSCTLAWHKSNLRNYFSDVDLSNEYYLFVNRSNYNNFYMYPSHTDGFIKYDPELDTCIFRTVPGDNLYYYRHFIYGSTINSFQSHVYSLLETADEDYVELQSFGANNINDDIYTNMNVRYYKDGSIIIFNPENMTPDTFNWVNDWVGDYINKSAIDWDSIEIADSNGISIENPASNIIDETKENMVTYDQMEEIIDGQADLSKYVSKGNAINKETNEVLGDVDEELDTQTGILGSILNVLKNHYRYVSGVAFGNVFSNFKNVINLLESISSALDKTFIVSIPGFSDLKEFVHNIQARVVWDLPKILEAVNPIYGILSTINDSILGKVFDFSIPDTIFDAIENVVKAITGKEISIPDSIPEAIERVVTAITGLDISIPAIDFGSIIQAISTVKEAVVDKVLVWSVPDSLFSSIAHIFVPNNDDFDLLISTGHDLFEKHFNMPTNIFDKFLIEGKEVPNVSCTFFGKKYTVIDFSRFNKFVDEFRVYIQTVFVFIWIVWLCNQFLSLFNKSGIMNGRIDAIVKEDD